MSKRYLDRRSAQRQEHAVEGRTLYMLATGAISAAIWEDPAALREERVRVTTRLRATEIEEDRVRLGHLVEVIERRLAELNRITAGAPVMDGVEVVYLQRRRSG